MKFIPQFPVQQLSGSDGTGTGLVAMRSNGIDIFRRYVVPYNPATAEQTLARSLFASSSQAFKLLTDEQRATWRTYAQLSPVTVLGREITLQEMAAFLRSDFYAYLIDTAHLTDAPAGTAGFSASDISTVTYDSGTTTLSIEVTHNGAASGGSFITKITNTAASAQRNPRPGDFRLVEGVTTTSIVAAGSSPQTMTFSSPVFSWADNDYMSVEVTPLSSDYAIGTPFRSRQQISVA